MTRRSSLPFSSYFQRLRSTAFLVLPPRFCSFPFPPSFPRTNPLNPFHSTHPRYHSPLLPPLRRSRYLYSRRKILPPRPRLRLRLRRPPPLRLLMKGTRNTSRTSLHPRSVSPTPLSSVSPRPHLSSPTVPSLFLNLSKCSQHSRYRRRRR